MLSLTSINKVGQRDLFGFDETNIFQRKCTNFYLHLSNIKHVFTNLPTSLKGLEEHIK